MKKGVRERIELVIVEEINHTNLKEPENYLPKFIQTLTDRLNELFADELRYRR